MSVSRSSRDKVEMDRTVVGNQTSATRCPDEARSTIVCLQYCLPIPCWYELSSLRHGDEAEMVSAGSGSAGGGELGANELTSDSLASPQQVSPLKPSISHDRIRFEQQCICRDGIPPSRRRRCIEWSTGRVDAQLPLFRSKLTGTPSQVAYTLHTLLHASWESSR